MGAHTRLLAVTYLSHYGHSHIRPAQVSSLWAQPGSHLSLYLQSLYTQQVTMEHLGTGLAVSPGRLRHVALLCRARSAPESELWGCSVHLSFWPQRAQTHPPILGIPEEGQTGRVRSVLSPVPEWNSQ